MLAGNSSMNYSKLNLAAFNKLNSQLEYYKEQSYKPYIDSYKELNFDELQKLVEKNIIEMEKSVDEFVKDIYLIIETPQTMSIQLSVIKNNEGKNITKQDALYLIQDAKQQILKSHLDIRILHIIVENYIFDDMEYKFLPLKKNCKKFAGPTAHWRVGSREYNPRSFNPSGGGPRARNARPARHPERHFRPLGAPGLGFLSILGRSFSDLDFRMDF